MIKFKTIDELYNTILPALKSKLDDLHYQGYVLINEKDIWNYLIDNKWTHSHDLELSNIIDDIFISDGYEISSYARARRSIKRKENLYEEE